MHILSGPEAITLRTVTPFLETLRSALAGSGPVGVDLSRVAEFDVAGFQVLESARLTARRQGTDLALTGAIPPVVTEVARRLGADPDRHPFWFAQVAA